MPLFRHPILLAPPETSASTAGVTVSWSTQGRAGPPSPVVDYNDGRVVTSMVSSGLSLNMVFDDRDSPITRGFEKVGVEGAKGLFLGTGEAF